MRVSVNDGNLQFIFLNQIFIKNKTNFIGTADFNSIFLQEIPLLFRKGAIKLNISLIHVSPPDVHGFCSLGTSVDATRAAVNCSDYVIGLLLFYLSFLY